MKREKIFLSAVAIVILLLGVSVPVAAAVNDFEEITCGVCQATLSAHGTHLYDYTSSHEVRYIVDGKLIVETCNVNHNIDQVDKICPTHGLRWSGKQHRELHSNIHCHDYRSIVYFE